MIKIFFRTIILSITTFIYASPGDASAIFLLISPGASAVGAGEAQVAKADDAYASYFNPAGLGFQTGSEFAGMHVNWLPGLADDIYYEFIAYKKNIPWLGTVGGNFTFLNLVNKRNLYSRLKKRKFLNRYDRFNMSFYNKVQNGFIKLSSLQKKKYQLINSNLNIEYNEKLILNKIDQLIK